MRATCVQCGEEFNISDRELDYFKENGLEVPKRCVKCRKENRRARCNESNVRNNSKKSTRFLGIALAIAFAFIAFWSSDTGKNVFGNLFSDTEKQTEQKFTSKDAVYAFRSFEYLEEHYKKHGISMGYKSEEEYLVGANRVILNQESLHKKEAEDNDDIYFMESTGESVVLSTDGFIRTYFKPEDGIDYYNRQ